MNYTLSAHSFNEPTLLAPYGASASAASAAVFAAREEEEGRKSVNARSDQIVENPRTVSAHLLSSWRRGGKKKRRRENASIRETRFKLQRLRFAQVEDAISQPQTGSVSQSFSPSASQSVSSF